MSHEQSQPGIAQRRFLEILEIATKVAAFQEVRALARTQNSVDPGVGP
jgi:hypothetical protein